MANFLTWIGIAGVLGCGSKAGDSSGSGSAAVAVAVAQDSATAVGSGAGSGSGSVSAAAACLPDDRGLAFGYIGRDLVTCMADDGTHTCWTIDRATGHVTPRAGTPVPGVGFGVPIEKLPKPNCLAELCWPAAAPDPDRRDASYIYVAYNPDGKRAVIDADPTVYVFDLATKKVTSSFDAGLGNSLHGSWFVGDTVMVSGADAGPYAVLDVYTPKGKKLVEYQGFYEGGLGVGSDGRAILQQTALEDARHPRRQDAAPASRASASSPPPTATRTIAASTPKSMTIRR